MPREILSPVQIADFHRDGYVIVRALFDTEEMDILRTAAKADAALRSNAYEVADGKGSAIRLALWNKAGENIYGMVARCPRIVDAMEQLLGDEVYHYHSKMSIKEPFVGGAWNWHQDYGYWYLNGCLYPDLASAFIAVDPNTRENGCMQVLRGSHLMGRVEHGKFGDQTGADLERVENARKIMDHVYVELAPGDVLFFHSNTLHASDQNNSAHPRWSFICCYNAKHNNPYKASHHPFYEKLEKVPDSRLKEMAAELSTENAEFWRPDQDNSMTGGGKTVLHGERTSKLQAQAPTTKAEVFAVSSGAVSPNPKGIPAQSPELREPSYPGTAAREDFHPNGVEARSTVAGHNPVGVVCLRPCCPG